MSSNNKKDQCGTSERYVKSGCRCDACKSARSKYKKTQRGTFKLGFGDETLSIKPLVRFCEGMDDDVMSEIFGLKPESIRQWRTKERRIDKFKADEYANRLGVHPSIIWGNAWFQIPFRLTKEHKDSLLA